MCVCTLAHTNIAKYTHTHTHLILECLLFLGEFLGAFAECLWESGVTVGLQWCYSGVTVVLQWCYSGVTVACLFPESITVIHTHTHTHTHLFGGFQ
jgi:hypothetical protein